MGRRWRGRRRWALGERWRSCAWLSVAMRLSFMVITSGVCAVGIVALIGQIGSSQVDGLPLAISGQAPELR